MSFDLEDKVALVTGAGGGIGRATAEALLGAGARVLSVDLPGRPCVEGAERLDCDLGEPDQIENPVYGFVNVRFYNLEGTDGDRVMDTLGLGALGLTDLQLHYRELAPGEVAAELYNIAVYLLENGDVIEDGHTVQGFTPEDRWRCRHEMSLMPPRRPVLDINPGPPFAAGDRE